MDIGQTLSNRYTLTARLGKGAMGTVYRATDIQTRQEVAVKVIARELALDHDMLERFRREGEALRQLRHPNIVGFVDMFEHEGQHLIAMEYVPGGSLHALIRQGPLPLDRARRIALELCDALTRAHHLNIIHRDLKPENVLIAQDGTPKLTDFGVARLISEGTRLTGTGTQVGTPFYMSPEAWEGKPLDAQTDIWSLGIMLYEMLSGQVPFGGDTIVAVMNKVLNTPLPTLKSLRPDVPTGLDKIIQRMLARDKAERYQSMRELGADLERGEPLTLMAAKPRRASVATRAKARGEKPAAQAKSEPSAAPRLWLLAGGLAIIILIALAGLGMAGWWLATHPPATPIATKPSLPPTTAGDTSFHSVCAPGETELFFDGFENGPASGWGFADVTGQNTAAWPVVTDGANHVLEAEGHRWATRPGGQDIALQVRLKRATPDAVAHLNLRISQAGRYYVGYYPEGMLVRNPPPGQTLTKFPLGNDTAWHSVRLAATGRHLEIRYDGQIIAQVDDVDGPLGGGIGLENVGGTMWYDDVLVCQLSGATPAPPASTAAQGSYPADRFGQALFLDGQTAYVEIPYSASLNLNSTLTLEGWFNIPRFPAQSCTWELCGLQALVSQGHAGSSAGNYTLAAHGRGLVFAFEPVDTKLIAPINGLDHGWHHVAVTHRFGTEQDSHWYLDGELLATTFWTNDAGEPTSGAAPVGVNSRAPYYLGFDATQRLYTVGWLDEIRIWNVVRSQAEIQANLRTELTGREPGLVAYWNFDEPAGATTVRDSSPGGNTGQLRGSAEIRTPETSAGGQKGPTAIVHIQSPTGCIPNQVPAGLIVLAYSAGSGSLSVDVAQQVVGKETYGTILVSGQTVPPATSAVAGEQLDSHGRTLNAYCNTQCGFTTFGAIQLEPGQYDVRASWPRADGNPAPSNCTLTVTAP